ncbi:MAG: hypothetical protein ACTSVA_02260 [Candidatus Njordarchaeales archaeon]
MKAYGIALVKWSTRIGYQYVLKIPRTLEISQDVLSLIFFKALSEEKRRRDVQYGIANTELGEVFWYYLGEEFSEPHVIIIRMKSQFLSRFLALDIATKYRRIKEKITKEVDDIFLNKIRLAEQCKICIIPIALSDPYRCKLYSIIAKKRELSWIKLLKETMDIHPPPSSTVLEEHIKLLNMARLINIKYEDGEKMIEITTLLFPEYHAVKYDQKKSLLKWEVGDKEYDTYLYRVCELITNKTLRKRVLELKRNRKADLADRLNRVLLDWGLLGRINENEGELVFLPSLVATNLRGRILFRFNF